MMGRIWAALCVLHVLRLGGASVFPSQYKGSGSRTGRALQAEGGYSSACLDGQKTIACTAS